MDTRFYDTVLADALDTLSPVDILNSTILLPRFQNFIARGSETERRLLSLTPSCQDVIVSQKQISLLPLCNARSFEAPDLVESEQRFTSSPAHVSSSSLPSISTSCSSTFGVESVQSPLPLSSIASEPSTHSQVASQSTHSSWFMPAVLTPSTVDDTPPLIVPSHASNLPSSMSMEIPLDSGNFFEKRLGSRSRHTKYLVRAVQGFHEVSDPDPESFKSMWSAKTHIFLGSGTSLIARIQRLHNGLTMIKRGRKFHDCASRFCHIFLEHELELLILSESFEMSQGRGRKTCALRMQAASLSATVANIKAARKAGRGYLQLLLEAGPGVLLILGSHVNTLWERKLSRGDVTVLLQYLKKFEPEVLQRGQALDKIAAQLIIDGFLAYGWSHSQLLHSGGLLLEQLSSYVDMPELALQHVAEDDGSRCDSTGSSLSPSTTSGIAEMTFGSVQQVCSPRNNTSLSDEMTGTPHLLSHLIPGDGSSSDAEIDFSLFETTYSSTSQPILQADNEAVVSHAEAEQICKPGGTGILFKPDIIFSQSFNTSIHSFTNRWIESDQLDNLW